MKLVVIQPVLPVYDCDFFNALLLNFPEIDLVVLADIKARNILNQYNPAESKFKVEHLPSTSFLGLVFRPGLLRLLRQHANSTLVFNGNPRDISQLLGMVLCWLVGRNVYVWGMFHRIGGPRFISNFYYKLAGMLACKCLCYSRTGAANLVRLGVSSARVAVVGTAINERVPTAIRLSKSKSALESFRKSVGLHDRQLVLQVVRLSRYKRPQILIDAAELLLAKRRDLVFALVGEGEMLSELQQMVADKGLSDYIWFLGAIYDEPVLANWYLSARAFVVPTCIGLSIHHAMAYGVPVITDDSLNQQASEFDILYDGLNGLIYSEGCAESLAQKIETVVNDEVLRARLSANALTTVNDIHTMNAKVRNFASLILSGGSK